MRKTLAAALFMLTLPVIAQEMPPVNTPANVLASVEDFAARTQRLATAVKREAFIVSQLVVATAQFHDEFQKHAALEKAHDRIEVAMRRAADRPPSPPVVLTAVSQVNDLVNAARRNPTSADLQELERQVLRKTNDIQWVLFREADDARKARMMVKDVMAKLSASSDLLDDSLSETMSSTLEYFKAGGGK